MKSRESNGVCKKNEIDIRGGKGSTKEGIGGDKIANI